jgi:hypothetical protein
MIFCDESSITERFFVLGALFFALNNEASPAPTIAKIEAMLKGLKKQYGLFGRVKWTSVPSARQKNKLDGYKSLMEVFATTKGIRFKCMVLDTKQYPLNNKKRWRGDSLVGYLKFYCVFLSDGLMARYPGHFYDITIDNYSFREGNDSQDLRSSVEGRYVNKTKKSRFHRHCEIKTADEEDSNLLQLTDILTGAVAFSWNGGKQRTSARAASKIELVSLLEKHFSINLSYPTARNRFGIWQFKTK